jgi:hypothetical protein
MITLRILTSELDVNEGRAAPHGFGCLILSFSENAMIGVMRKKSSIQVATSVSSSYFQGNLQFWFQPFLKHLKEPVLIQEIFKIFLETLVWL